MIDFGAFPFGQVFQGKECAKCFPFEQKLSLPVVVGIPPKVYFSSYSYCIAELDNVGIVLSFFRGGGVMWWLNISRVEHSLIAQITLATSPACSVRSNMSLESLAIVVLTNHHHAGIFLFTR